MQQLIEMGCGGILGVNGKQLEVPASVLTGQSRLEPTLGSDACGRTTPSSTYPGVSQVRTTVAGRYRGARAVTSTAGGMASVVAAVSG